VRTFLVAASNNAGGGAGCIAWAATDPAGAILFHEQFYAAKGVRLTAPWAGSRTTCRRRSSSAWSALRSGSARASPAADRRGADLLGLRAGGRGLPEQLTSYYITHFRLGSGYTSVMSSVSGNAGWDFSKRPENVNWPNGSRIALGRAEGSGDELRVD